MFLSAFSDYGLFPPDSAGGPLSKFSTASVNIICKEFVMHLSPGAKGVAEVVARPEQVDHLLTTLQHGCTLPLGMLDTISSIMRVYRAWLVGKEGTYPSILDHPKYKQGYLQSICKQLSLVFDCTSKGRSSPDSEQLQGHIKVCHSALDLFSLLCTQPGLKTQPQTYDTLLRVLLGLCQYMWSQNTADAKSLPHHLVDKLAQTTFDCFIMSQSTDKSVWSQLSSMFPSWCHLTPVVLQWKNVCLSLTNRMLNLLYGPTEGTPTIVLSGSAEVQVADEFVFFSWRQMIALMANVASSSAGPSQSAAVYTAVEEMVSCYLEVGRHTLKMKKRRRAARSAPQQEQEAFLSPVDGNTLIRMFGSYLFDAVISNRPGYEEGTVVASRVMINIFLSSNNSAFDPRLLARFYAALAGVLQGPASKVMGGLLASCAWLYTNDLEGVHILLPTMFNAIHRVLQERREDNAALYGACMNLLSSLVCLPDHFGSAALHPLVNPSAGAAPRGAGMEGIFGIKDFRSLKPFYIQLLQQAIQQEAAADTSHVLMWTFFLYAAQELQSEVGDVGAGRMVLDLYLNKMGKPGVPCPSVLTALRGLSALTFYYDKLSEREARAQEAVAALQKRIREFVDAGPPADPDRALETYVVVTACLYCMVDWLMTGQWVYKAMHVPTEVGALLMSLLRMRDAPAKDQKIPSTLFDAANYALIQLINNVGSYPTSKGSGSMASLLHEGHLLASAAQGSHDVLPYLRYYAMPGMGILAIVERPDLQDTVSVIIRDKKGRWVWDLTQAQTSFEDRKQPEPSPPPPVEVHREDVPEAARVPDSQVPAAASAFASLAAANSQMATAIKATDNFFVRRGDKSHDIPARDKPERPTLYTGKGRTTLSRLFLSNLGFLSLHNRSRMLPIKQSRLFYQHLRKLDFSTERDCQRIGISYIKTGQRTRQQVLTNQGGSPEYRAFLSALGWGVDVKNNPRNLFLGGLDAPELGVELAPYYATYSLEMIFMPTTDMKNETDEHSGNLTAQLPKQKLIDSAPVVIIWTEDLDAYNPSFFPLSKCHIVVSPLRTGLYHCAFINNQQRTAFDTNVPTIGPIVDRTLLSTGVLANMVRLTALNAFRSLRAPPQFTDRQTLLEQIISRHSVDMPIDSYYGSLYRWISAAEQEAYPMDMSASELLALPLPASLPEVEALVDSPAPEQMQSPVLMVEETSEEDVDSSVPSTPISGPPPAREEPEEEEQEEPLTEQPTPPPSSPAVGGPPLPSRSGPPIPSAAKGTGGPPRPSLSVGGPPLPSSSPKGPPLPSRSSSGGPPIPSAIEKPPSLPSAPPSAGRAKRKVAGRGGTLTRVVKGKRGSVKVKRRMSVSRPPPTPPPT